MKKMIIIGAINFKTCFSELENSCVDLKSSIEKTSENINQLGLEINNIKFQKENKHPFDKFINGRKSKRNL